jgi:hypothetical protein
LISQNEIDAAKTVKWEFLNAQEQQKIVWPPSFAKARAFVDQLERSNGLPAARIKATRDALAAAEKQSGNRRQQALKTLASQVTQDGAGSSDASKVQMLVAALGELK